jgi:hypothetical protein
LGAETTVTQGEVALSALPQRRLLSAAIVLVLVTVVGLLIGPPAILLVASVVSGIGITYLSQAALNLEERLAFGTVLGAMAICAFGFAASMIARDVTIATVSVGLVAALAVGVAGAALRRARLAADLQDAAARWSAPLRAPGHPWPVAAIFAVCAAWTVHFLHQAYVVKPDGIYAGYVNIWGDWAAHLTFTGSFAYAHNFPPEYPIDPGNHLGYPFMIDFLAAQLVPLGSTLPSSLVLSSGLLGLAFPAVLYLAAARFAGGRAAAAIAVSAFLLSGGFGFIYLVGDLQQSGLKALVHLPREYTLNRDLNYQWLNPVLAYLVPQRSTLFGFSLALITLVVLWLAVREGHGWPAYLFAGVVTGLMPAFHVHAFGTVVALSMFWAVFNRRRQWLAFFIPALLVGVAILRWMWPPAQNTYCGGTPTFAGYCLELGWLSYLDWQKHSFVQVPVDWLWFWLKNLSVFVPLLVAAHFARRRLPTRFDRWYAPMWLWFLVPNVIVLQPWDWDNTKFFIFWALLGSILVGALLAEMFKRGPALAGAAAALLVLLGLSGALDLARASDYSVSSFQFTDTKGLQVAEWVRTHTPADSVFAVADEHNNPIPTFGGRRVMSGYPGWLWTYGLGDYGQKGTDELAILRGDPKTPQLVAKYGVDYVLIGPQELAPPRNASVAYWTDHGALVYSNGEYSVFRVNITA